MKEILTRLEQNLGKLRRNMEQMNEEQKQRFAKPLRKLRMAICSDASEAANSFIREGIRISNEDDSWKDVVRGINLIMREEKAKGNFKMISDVLFSGFDIEQMLMAVMPIRHRVWFEAYGPYWLKHCTGNPMYPDFPYHNDLIGMDWLAEKHIWASTKTENGEMVIDYQRGLSLMLPPTKELLEEKYAKEMAEAVETLKALQEGTGNVQAI